MKWMTQYGGENLPTYCMLVSDRHLVDEITYHLLHGSKWEKVPAGDRPHRLWVRPLTTDPPPPKH